MKCHERKREEREWADNLFGFSFKAAVKEGKEERERERRAEKKRKKAQALKILSLKFIKDCTTNNLEEVNDCLSRGVDVNTKGDCNGSQWTGRG